MHDSRINQLASQLVNHSTKVQTGERVLIEVFDVPSSVSIALIREIRAKGGIPFVNIHDSVISREMSRGATSDQFDAISRVAMAQMENMDAYIAIRGSNNITEQSDVPAGQMKLVSDLMRPVINHRVNETRWVVLRWPSSAMAQQASMSTEAFEDYYFNVCLLDYQKFDAPMNALKQLMDKTEKVHITGPGTDLKFSIKGLKAIACGGAHNIPDGEVFTAPVKHSVEGTIQYNTPTIYQGTAFDDIRLTFEKGKIIEATSSNTKALNRILDQDEGARYIGEFALGFNPAIREPMRDILFDEKIAGSFHFTPGQAYEGIADNGNRSQVHWDMVCIQREDYEGGEIWFDDTLIRKDGEFLPKELAGLNS